MRHASRQRGFEPASCALAGAISATKPAATMAKHLISTLSPVARQRTTPWHGLGHQRMPSPSDRLGLLGHHLAQATLGAQSSPPGQYEGKFSIFFRASGAVASGGWVYRARVAAFRSPRGGRRGGGSRPTLACSTGSSAPRPGRARCTCASTSRPFCLDVDAACVRRRSGCQLFAKAGAEDRLVRRRRHLRLDPLDRSRSHPELCGDLQDAPVRLRQGLPDALLGAGGDFGPTEGLAVARARLSPALTRLTIIDRSNWAKTPHNWNIASPAGVEVSRACWWRYRPTPAP